MRVIRSIMNDLNNMHSKSEDEYLNKVKMTNRILLGLYFILVFIGSGFFLPLVICLSMKLSASTLYEGEMTFAARWGIGSVKMLVYVIAFSAVFAIFDWFVPGARNILYFNLWDLL